MLPFLRGEFGNPSSAYALGRRAHDAVEQRACRGRGADRRGAGGDRLHRRRDRGDQHRHPRRGGAGLPAAAAIVTTNIEHPATEACCDLLERAGHAVRRVAAEQQRHRVGGAHGGRDRRRGPRSSPSSTPRTRSAPSSRCARSHAPPEARGALVHADAAQSVGKIPVDVAQLGVDLLTIAGHKLYAPKGIGALYVRRGVKLPPLIVGAGQEHGLRPGTENVAFIVALGAACALAGTSARRLRASARPTCRRAPARLLQREVPGLVLVGDRERRLPNTLNVLFPGVSGPPGPGSLPARAGLDRLRLSRRQRGALRHPHRARHLPRQGAGCGAPVARARDDRAEVEEAASELASRLAPVRAAAAKQLRQR